MGWQKSEILIQNRKKALSQNGNLWIVSMFTYSYKFVVTEENSTFEVLNYFFGQNGPHFLL